jgi:CopG family nickel-responsive transcriptional regulator
MQRVTISVDDALAGEFDALAESRGYESRSEAIRDLLREALRAGRSQVQEGYCVANLSYIYNHRERDLATVLTDVQHEHHELVLATAHVHLDHDFCLETVMLKGPVARVRAFSDHIQAQRGVRHGALNVIPVEPGDQHAHEHAHAHAGASHLSPKPG